MKGIGKDDQRFGFQSAVGAALELPYDNQRRSIIGDKEMIDPETRSFFSSAMSCGEWIK